MPLHAPATLSVFQARAHTRARAHGRLAQGHLRSLCRVPTVRCGWWIQSSDTTQRTTNSRSGRGDEAAVCTREACDLAALCGDHARDGPRSLATIAACTPTAGHWRSNWTQDKGPGYWRSSLPCRHARPVRFDMAISRARISSGVGMAVDILSVDSCAVNSSSRPISAARASRASAQLGADGVCCSPSQPVPWRTPSQTG